MVHVSWACSDSVPAPLSARHQKVTRGRSHNLTTKWGQASTRAATGRTSGPRLTRADTPRKWPGPPNWILISVNVCENRGNISKDLISDSCWACGALRLLWLPLAFGRLSTCVCDRKRDNVSAVPGDGNKTSQNAKIKMETICGCSHFKLKFILTHNLQKHWFFLIQPAKFSSGMKKMDNKAASGAIFASE